MQNTEHEFSLESLFILRSFTQFEARLNEQFLLIHFRPIIVFMIIQVKLPRVWMVNRIVGILIDILILNVMWRRGKIKHLFILS